MPRHKAVVQEPEAEADMPDQVIAAIRFGMDSIKEICKDILPLCSGDMQKNITSRLDTRFRQLIKAELVYEESSRIVNRVVEEMPNDENSDDTAILKSCENIADISRERVETYEQELTDESIENSTHYCEFQEAVQAAIADVAEDDEETPGGSSFDLQSDDMETEGEEEDSEEEEEDDDEDSTAEVLPTTDPITKKPLKDPIRNKFCKHIYGKKAIMGLLKANPKFRCPTIGCSNKRFIKEAHLVADEKLVSDVKKMQGKKRRGKKYY